MSRLKVAAATAALGLTMGAGGVVAAAAPASASCTAAAGSMCIEDYNVSTDHIYYDNDWWGNFGSNDRYDFFRNDGLSCSVTIYQNINYGGSSIGLSRGASAVWYDTVSSNRWCQF